jgi:hypothetical protein
MAGVGMNDVLEGIVGAEAVIDKLEGRSHEVSQGAVEVDGDGERFHDG